MISDILNAFRERVQRPVAGAFLFSYVACNYKPLMILFLSTEGISIENRFAIAQPYWDELSRVWLLPLLMTIFYLVGLPWIEVGFNKLISKPIFYLRKRKLSVEDELDQLKLEREVKKAKMEKASEIAEIEIARSKKMVDLEERERELKERESRASFDYESINQRKKTNRTETVRLKNDKEEFYKRVKIFNLLIPEIENYRDFLLRFKKSHFERETSSSRMFSEDELNSLLIQTQDIEAFCNKYLEKDEGFRLSADQHMSEMMKEKDDSRRDSETRDSW